MGCSVGICSDVVLRGTQGDNCSGTQKASFPIFFIDFGLSRAVSFMFFPLLSEICCAVFSPLNPFPQGATTWATGPSHALWGDCWSQMELAALALLHRAALQPPASTGEPYPV